jgi:hypothetical protein
MRMHSLGILNGGRPYPRLGLQERLDNVGPSASMVEGAEKIYLRTLGQFLFSITLGSNPYTHS